MAQTTKESLESMFAKVEKKVARTGRIYDAPYEELQKLRKNGGIKKKHLWKRS